MQAVKEREKELIGCGVRFVLFFLFFLNQNHLNLRPKKFSMIKYFDKPGIRKITGFPVVPHKEEKAQRSFSDRIIRYIPLFRILAVLWFSYLFIKLLTYCAQVLFLISNE
jgi:hypothetical protein